jgi:5-methylcytosine-specific restriction protein A
MRRSISKKERAEIFNVRAGKCHICGQKIHPDQKWDIEHIIPLALGGADSGENLDLAHQSCHRDKTKADVGRLAKARRQAAYHNGKKLSKTPLPCGKSSKWKRKLDGSLVRRDEGKILRSAQEFRHRGIQKD